MAQNALLSARAQARTAGATVRWLANSTNRGHHKRRLPVIMRAGWKVNLPEGNDPYKTDLGVYRGNPAATNFPPAKSGTLEFVNPDLPGAVGYWATTHAEPWFILITSLTHYLTFATQFAVGLAYFSCAPALLTSSAAAGGIPFLLIAGPLFQAMGGSGPNLMHEYEGFEITPFQAYPPKDPTSQMAEYNNDALRQVAYRSLFQLQAVGGAMFGMGALWPAQWPVPAAWAALVALALAAYFCPRDVFYLRIPAGKVELLLPPLPTYPLALFAVGVVLQLSGLVHFFGVPLGVGITVLLAAGGLLEAGLAEGVYDQRWHLLAVVMLNGGGWLQVAALNNWWGQPAFQAVAVAVLAAVGAMVLLPGGALPDLVKKLNSDPPLKP